MIGETIENQEVSFKVIKKLTGENRPNADIYLCEDANGKKYIAKHFYGSSPRENLGLNLYNHYGRRREGSELVFGEINRIQDTYDFIVKHLHRIKHKGKVVVIIEHIEGILFSEFLSQNWDTNPKKVEIGVIALAEILTEWHTNGFAQGDPHLDNVIIQEVAPGKFKAYIIDYSQIHHRSFKYCDRFDCFNSDPLRRINEDLGNDIGKVGSGFRYGLIDFETAKGIAPALTEIFDKHYITLNT